MRRVHPDAAAADGAADATGSVRARVEVARHLNRRSTPCAVRRWWWRHFCATTRASARSRGARPSCFAARDWLAATRMRSSASNCTSRASARPIKRSWSWRSAAMCADAGAVDRGQAPFQQSDRRPAGQRVLQDLLQLGDAAAVRYRRCHARHRIRRHGSGSAGLRARRQHVVHALYRRRRGETDGSDRDMLASRPLGVPWADLEASAYRGGRRDDAAAMARGRPTQVRCASKSSTRCSTSRRAPTWSAAWSPMGFSSTARDRAAQHRGRRGGRRDHADRGRAEHPVRHSRARISTSIWSRWPTRSRFSRS